MGDHEEEEEAEEYCRGSPPPLPPRQTSCPPSFIPRVQVGMTKLACTPFVAACTLTPSRKQQYFAGNEEKGKGRKGGLQLY